MSLSEIAKTIQSSPTLALNEKAAILREKGDPVIHLGGGEPKCKVPMEAINITAATQSAHCRLQNFMVHAATRTDSLRIAWR